MKTFSYLIFAAVLTVAAIVAWSERATIADGLRSKERWKIEIGNGRAYEIEIAAHGDEIKGRVLTVAKDHTYSDVTGTRGGKFVQLAFVETLAGTDGDYSLTRVSQWRLRGERDGGGMKGEAAVHVDKREHIDGEALDPQDFSFELKWIAFRQ